jgi:hemerythrin-like domain-containing protein
VFRFAIPKLNSQLDHFLQTPAPTPDAVAFFVSQLEDFFLTYHEHGQHEEQILFPEIRRFFPQLNPSMDEEHEWEHTILEEMTEAIKVWKSGNAADPAAVTALLRAIGDKLPGWSKHLLDHLRNEERTATVVIRKYTTLEQQKDLANRCWNLTPSANWTRVLPYTIRNLPVPMWKVNSTR